MDKMTSYLSPITVEAEIFLNSLQSLTKNYNSVDIILVSTLEKIMNAIENFLDSAPSEIVETKFTKLVKCDDVSQISRIFCCSLCKKDIGKSVENVVLHLTEGCSVACNEQKNIYKLKTNRNVSKERKQTFKDLDIRNKTVANGSKKHHSKELTKKTVSLLKTNLSQFIEDHVKIGAKLKCIPAYDKIETDLLGLATPLFPNKSVQVYKFGSRIAGMGHRDSDLDLYMDIDDTFNCYQNRADNEAVEKLEAVEKGLKKDSSSWRGLRAIKKARVPILKVIHAETGIDCDINFSNSMGIMNTRLLEYLFNLQPLTQPLCCYIKKWVNRTKLGDAINTYSTNLMVLFYLQTLNLLPSIERLQRNVQEDKAFKVGVWICMYSTYTLKELNIEPLRVDQPNMLKYIRSFFDFYAKFNFRQNVVCPYFGRIITKKELENSMPNRYTNYVESFPKYNLDMGTPLTVQDPLQLNYNTTKNLDDSTLNILKQNMVNSLLVLNEQYLEDV